MLGASLCSWVSASTGQDFPLPLSPCGMDDRDVPQEHMFPAGLCSEVPSVLGTLGLWAGCSFGFAAPRSNFTPLPSPGDLSQRCPEHWSAPSWGFYPAVVLPCHGRPLELRTAFPSPPAPNHPPAVCQSGEELTGRGQGVGWGGGRNLSPSPYFARGERGAGSCFAACS